MTWWEDQEHLYTICSYHMPILSLRKSLEEDVQARPQSARAGWWRFTPQPLLQLVRISSYVFPASQWCYTLALQIILIYFRWYQNFMPCSFVIHTQIIREVWFAVVKQLLQMPRRCAGGVVETCDQDEREARGGEKEEKRQGQKGVYNIHRAGD